MAFQARVLTVSDSASQGHAEDLSGPVVVKYLEERGFEVVDRRIVPDGVGSVAETLRDLTRGFAGLVVTTGGTGFAPRDLTPEATAEVVERQASSLAEAMHRSGPNAPLSRGLAGIVGRSIVLNLPGSPKGAVESLAAVIDVLPHALALLAGEEPHSRAHSD